MISDMILDNGEKVRVVLHAYLRDEDVLANKRKHKELLATHTEFIKKYDVRLDEEIASYVDDETADWDFTELIFGLFVPDAEESCAMMDAVICNIFLVLKKMIFTIRHIKQSLMQLQMQKMRRAISSIAVSS